MELAKYRIKHGALTFLEPLGQGGQAIVHAATLHGQRVAVKKYTHNQSPDIFLIASLNHRNIVRLLCVDV
jgi:hypothetical protein